MYEELWKYGLPQEMEHFVDCGLSNREPLDTGADRTVLEILDAMYLAAGDRGRVRLPLELDEISAAEPPISSWRRPPGS